MSRHDVIARFTCHRIDIVSLQITYFFILILSNFHSRIIGLLQLECYRSFRLIAEIGEHGNIAKKKSYKQSDSFKDPENV